MGSEVVSGLSEFVKCDFCSGMFRSLVTHTVSECVALRVSGRGRPYSVPVGDE